MCQLRMLLRSVDPTCCGVIHAADEREIARIEQHRSVAASRKVRVLTELCAVLASREEPDRPYEANESQQSTESQVDSDFPWDTEGRCNTPQRAAFAVDPDSIERLGGAARRRRSARASSWARCCACTVTRTTRPPTARASGSSTRWARRRRTPRRRRAVRASSPAPRCTQCPRCPHSRATRAQ